MNAPLTRTAIVEEARAWIGTPYRHQASLKGVGCDCLGLIRGVWRAVMGEEPERNGVSTNGHVRVNGSGWRNQMRGTPQRTGMGRWPRSI